MSGLDPLTLPHYELASIRSSPYYYVRRSRLFTRSSWLSRAPGAKTFTSTRTLPRWPLGVTRLRFAKLAFRACSVRGLYGPRCLLKRPISVVVCLHGKWITQHRLSARLYGGFHQASRPLSRALLHQASNILQASHAFLAGSFPRLNPQRVLP